MVIVAKFSMSASRKKSAMNLLHHPCLRTRKPTTPQYTEARLCDQARMNSHDIFASQRLEFCFDVLTAKTQRHNKRGIKNLVAPGGTPAYISKGPRVGVWVQVPVARLSGGGVRTAKVQESSLLERQSH